jgi:hypothetical protein
MSGDKKCGKKIICSAFTSEVCNKPVEHSSHFWVLVFEFVDFILNRTESRVTICNAYNLNSAQVCCRI